MIKKISASNISFRSKVRIADKTTNSYNSLDNFLSAREESILKNGIKSLERNGNYDSVTFYVDNNKKMNNVGISVTELRNNELSLGHAQIRRDDWGELSLEKIKNAYNEARKNLSPQKPSVLDAYRVYQ